LIRRLPPELRRTIGTRRNDASRDPVTSDTVFPARTITKSAAKPVLRHAGAAFMESLIFRGRPDENNECDQWSIVREADDDESYVVVEHVKLDAFLAGKPYLRLVKRMTTAEFLSTDQPPTVKQRLLAALEARTAPQA
jgi:hypothetical protein